MIYEKCIECPKIGKTCNGPDFSVRQISKVREWCRTYRQRYNIPLQLVSDRGNVPLSTVRRFFGPGEVDFQYDTVVGIMHGLLGDVFNDHPCHSPDGIEIDQLQTQIDHKTELVEHLRAENERLSEQNKTIQADMHSRMAFLKRFVVIVCIALFVCLVTMIFALIIDLTHPGIGFLFIKG